jgi:hypothetical protein
MTEPKPNWYKDLQEDPLRNHSFTLDLAARIKTEAARSVASSLKNLRVWLGAGVMALLLLGFGFVRMYVGTDFLMKPTVQLDVTPTLFTSIQPTQEPTNEPTIVPTPTFRPTPQPIFNGRYLVHSGFYYDRTDAVIPLDQIGKELGTVSRIGDWAIKKEWDSNEFGTGVKIFAITGVSPDERLAVRVQVRSPKNKESSYDYQEVKRAAALEVLDPSILLGAKGDKEEVAVVMQNIREVDPYIYEFNGLSSPIELFFANFADKYVENASYYGTYLKYIYPLADDANIQGWVEVAEYSEEMKLQHMLNGSIFAVDEAELKVLREFDSGHLHWKDYGDQIYVAKQNDHYYEIKLQGKLSDEQLQELLSHLGPVK